MTTFLMKFHPGNGILTGAKLCIMNVERQSQMTTETINYLFLIPKDGKIYY